MQEAPTCNKSYIPSTDEYLSTLQWYASTMIVIGSLITIGLFVLFLEQVVYTHQTAHHAFRRHICWITSVFPMMTLMSLVALIQPRSHVVCQSVKMVYMSIGISHFTDLTMVMFGEEQVLIERGKNDVFNLRTGPMCCCCRCLPYPPVTKYSLRLIVLLTDQLPFIQAFYYMVQLILISADNITLGDVDPKSAFLWLNLIKTASALFGVYGFMIMSSFSHGYLDDFKYRRKSRSIRLLLLITNFQSLIFSIMANYNVFPCLPPYVSSVIYKQVVDNSLYVLEMMILGPYTFWQYHDPHFASAITFQPTPSERNNSVSNDNQDDHSSSSTTTIDLSVTSEDHRSVQETAITTPYFSMKENGELVLSMDGEMGNCVNSTYVSGLETILGSDGGNRCGGSASGGGGGSRTDGDASRRMRIESNNSKGESISSCIDNIDKQRSVRFNIMESRGNNSSSNSKVVEASRRSSSSNTITNRGENNTSTDGMEKQARMKGSRGKNRHTTSREEGRDSSRSIETRENSSKSSDINKITNIEDRVNTKTTNDNTKENKQKAKTRIPVLRYELDKKQWH